MRRTGTCRDVVTSRPAVQGCRPCHAGAVPLSPRRNEGGVMALEDRVVSTRWLRRQNGGDTDGWVQVGAGLLDTVADDTDHVLAPVTCTSHHDGDHDHVF